MAEKQKMEDELNLYKYRHLKDRNRISEIFVEQKVWFASYDSFYDPFELRFNYSFEATTDEKITFFTKMFLKQNMPIERAIAEARSIVSSKDKLDTFENRLKDRTHPNEDYQELGIFSLSEHIENILLWSHYTEGHKGICIEFKAIEGNSEQREFLGQAQPVEYSKGTKIPITNVYKDDRYDISSMLNKVNYWEYEGEYRIIDLNGQGHRSLPEGIISAVYLGCNISDDDRKFISECINRYTAKVDIYQAKKKRDYYELEFSIIDG